MGTSESVDKYKVIDLPDDLVEKCQKLFSLLDVDGDKIITRNETMVFWAKNFPKTNSFNIFDQIDRDGDLTLSEDEWVNFWRKVAASGMHEDEISTRLDFLMKGHLWERFDHLGKARIDAEEKEKEKTKGCFICVSTNRSYS